MMVRQITDRGYDQGGKLLCTVKCKLVKAATMVSTLD